MQIARVTAHACLTALSWMLVFVSLLLIAGFVINISRDGNMAAVTRGGVFALVVAIGLSYACRWGARKFSDS